MKQKFSRQQVMGNPLLAFVSSLNNNNNRQSFEEESMREAQNNIQLPIVDKLQQLLSRITVLQDPLTHAKLIDKYSIPYLIRVLDKNKLQSIDKIYNMKPQGFNLLQFTRFFLNAIQHSQHQTLYLTMGLVDFFKAIAENNNTIERIKFIHLTDFICLSILNSQQDANSNNITGTSSTNSYSQNKIDMKLIPDHKVITPNYQIKPYMINPPKIYGNKDQTVYKLSQTNIKTDKNKHDSVVTCCSFSNSYKKIFSLDALAEAIYIFDVNCKLQRKLKPQNLKVKKDVVLLAFAYSQRQQRIGAVLKDFTLSFWDFNDNLQFQKVISTASSCQQYQTNIWYLQYFQSWITSDRTGIIYIWNLQTQKPQRKIQCKFKGKINDVCEIPCLNILAVAQQSRGSNKFNNNTIKQKQIDENKIILYNYFKGEQISEISSMNDMRIPHTLQYSQTYQVLLSAGFEKKINIFQINHKYLDTSLKGELLGHQNLITNFTLVKKTPMVVSCDDKGKVKIWDLRSYKCIQTLDFRDKTVITRLLDMVQIGKFGVLGSRINFLQYDQRQQIIKKYQSHEKNTPLNINFIYETNKLLITTKKDLRIYDMKTGGVERVYCEFHTKDQEIVIFKYYELMRKLLITNEKGEIRLVSIQGGLMQGGGGDGGEDGEGRQRDDQKLEGFTNGSVTHVEYDQQNKLFLTCGGNGTIKIHKLLITLNPNNEPKLPQQATKSTKLHHNNKRESIAKAKLADLKPYSNQQWTVIRQMRGNFNNKDMTSMAFSVYHGMIAVGSSCNQVYVWDYEYAKLLFGVSLPDGVQPTAMSFINGFSILLIAASNGQVYFIKLLRQNQQQYQQKSSAQKPLGPQHLLTFKDNRQLVATNPNSNNSLQLTEQQDHSDYITQIIVDISLKGTIAKSKSIEFVKIYMAYSSGKIAIMELSQMLRKHPILPHRKTLPTYNPQRQLKQQFGIELQKNKTLMLAVKSLRQQQQQQQQTDANNNRYQFPYAYQFLKPHSGAINEMKILQFDKHYLVTCGNERIKLWGELEDNSKEQPLSNNTTIINNTDSTTKSIISPIQLLGDFNINHPLPYLWNFTLNNDKKIRDKIMFSLKIIQSIFKKFGSDISTGQSKILKLEKFFKSLTPNDNNNNSKRNVRDSLSSKIEEGYKYLTQPECIKQQSERQKGLIQRQKPITFQSSNTTKQQKTNKQQRPYLFQQEFTKKDLHYDQIKKYNFYQIGGPSLRELQFRKKMDTMQKQWQMARLKQQQQKSEMMSKILFKAQRNEQKQQIISFLQDRRLLAKRNANHVRANSTNGVFTTTSNNYNASSTTVSNVNTNRSNNNNNNINIRDDEQPQFPVVKRITQQLNRIETYQQGQMRETANSGVGNYNTTLMKSHSYMSKFGNTSTSGVMKTALTTMQASILDTNLNLQSEQKPNYGYLLRKYYNSTSKSSANISKSSANISKLSANVNNNPKGFEQYYFKKQPSNFNNKDNLQQTKQRQQQDRLKRNNDDNDLPQRRLQKISASHSKTNTIFSLVNNNSRAESQQSLRNKSQLLSKVKSNQHLSFQTILKDMNNRVLQSRQGRTIAQNYQEIDTQRVFEYPKQREKKGKRLTKNTNYVAGQSTVSSYVRENKIN